MFVARSLLDARGYNEAFSRITEPEWYGPYGLLQPSRPAPLLIPPLPAVRAIHVSALLRRV